MRETMIEFDGVSRSFGSKVAVDQLNLQIPKGELFAFLGPNGAGKTTTIKMLVGLLYPSQGSIKVAGIDRVKQPRESGRYMGYVPDEPYVYEKLTGLEFLEFVAGMYGYSRQQAQERVAREIEHFELHGFLNDLAETYSLGMRQRLVFASALLHDPQVLVLDEPMVGLDPRTARLTKNLLRQIADRGTTIFMSTHTLEMAEELADRVGIVVQGKVRFVGTIAELEREASLQYVSLEKLFLKVTGASGVLANGTPQAAEENGPSAEMPATPPEAPADSSAGSAHGH